jgi:hypothetical protein
MVFCRDCRRRLALEGFWATGHHFAVSRRTLKSHIAGAQEIQPGSNQPGQRSRADICPEEIR